MPNLLSDGARWRLIHGDSLEQLPLLPENSVSACVCDPPYELGFMGRSWDSTGIAYNVTLWREVLRVLKPGGHLLAFGGSRTFHRLFVAIEDAGFEIRDELLWIYGSGFPKSLNVSKALDKRAGHERNTAPHTRTHAGGADFRMQAGGTPSLGPQTDEARAWEGWGTALKPAHEPICLARKPLVGTVAENVLTHGTGALNIGASLIGIEPRFNPPTRKGKTPALGSFENCSGEGTKALGRWPANVLLSEDAARDLDESAGENDSGGPSRFFYTAKAGSREREAGLERFEEQAAGGMEGRHDGSLAGGVVMRKNHHPTVKPIELMEYLIKLVTPSEGIVLDPFTGSGSTGCAALRCGFRFLGIELEREYFDRARERLSHFACENLFQPLE